jgi:hypothetical protein
MLDLVFSGGLVVDGSGTPARRADVGVRDAKVVAMLRNSRGRAEMDRLAQSQTDPTRKTGDWATYTLLETSVPRPPGSRAGPWVTWPTSWRSRRGTPSSTS